MKNKRFTICLKSYFRNRLKLLILFLLFINIFGLVFYLYNSNTESVFYAALICAIIGVATLIFDFNKFYSMHKKLLAATQTITITLDNLPKTSSLIEQDYQHLLELLYQHQSKIFTETAASKQHMQDYYAMWVHQIKVPISAMHLLMEGSEKNSPLKIELFKIEQYVEMALSYVRLESNNTDYLIKEYNLDSIVKQAVRKYAPLFIAKKIRLDISDINVEVITDEKWAQFVIEQILSNSLKYTKTGTITISLKNSKTLVISDTGIGIAPEDISRIGEKGFTGYNGRIDKKSTGLGLYLCKEILKKLSHKIYIESQLYKGTTIYIDFETRKMLFE